jgi:DNA mismatch repair protein MutL
VISRSVETVGDVSVDGQTVQVVGQLWQTYILLEGEEGVYRVDQHALAERITFEKMRQQVQDQGFRSEVLLAPITVSYPSDVEVQSVIRQLQQVGFDLSEFGNQKVIVHAVPEVFVTYKIDLELLFNQVWHMEEVNFDLLLDEVLGMKACKASIKAGQKLSHLEMRQLIEDGVQMLPGMFVCQHGRPSVVKIEKSKIDQMFDRS